MNLELKIKKKDFPVRIRNKNRDGLEGIAYRIRLNDRYEVDVIKDAYSYGHEVDKWEIGLVDTLNDRLVWLGYDFGIQDDIIGYLTDEEVEEWIEKFYEKFCRGRAV